MLTIRWRPEAEDELATVLDFVAMQSPRAAADLLDAIERQVAQLPYQPYIYRQGRAKGTRELVVHSHYIVVYRILTFTIEIVSVLHSRRQYP